MSIHDKSILVVDDVKINRVMLLEIFKDEFDVIEASNGREAVDIINGGSNVGAVLLDLIMPDADGFVVLKNMNETGLIKKIPVLIITGTKDKNMLMEAYDLGATSIVAKPFVPYFLRRQITNAMELYSQKNELEVIVSEQVAKFNKMSHSIVEAMANIIEFRDCETGKHVKNVCEMTRSILMRLGEMCPDYKLPVEEIDKISIAAALHDVGKISIPDAILNKPGKLTMEEYQIMKRHTTNGCVLLETVKDIIEPELYRYCYDICRHHHERWDGKGYPDGVAGDENEIWSQAVAVADVYDALTSDRVYKKAFSQDVAVDMIFNGECGQFNPAILEALKAVQYEK